MVMKLFLNKIKVLSNNNLKKHTFINAKVTLFTCNLYIKAFKSVRSQFITITKKRCRICSEPGLEKYESDGNKKGVLEIRQTGRR